MTLRLAGAPIECIPVRLDERIEHFLVLFVECANRVRTRHDGRKQSWAKTFPTTVLEKNAAEYVERVFGGPPEKVLPLADVERCLHLMEKSYARVRVGKTVRDTPMVSADEIGEIRRRHAPYVEAMSEVDARKNKALLKPVTDTNAAKGIIGLRLDRAGLTWGQLKDPEVFLTTFDGNIDSFGRRELQDRLRAQSALVHLLTRSHDLLGYDEETRFFYLSQIAESGAYNAYALGNGQVERQMFGVLRAVHRETGNLTALQRILLTSSYYDPSGCHAAAALDLPEVLDPRWPKPSAVAPRLLMAAIDVLASGGVLRAPHQLLKGRSPKEALAEARQRAVRGYQKQNIDSYSLFAAMDAGDLALAGDVDTQARMTTTVGTESSAANIEFAQGEWLFRQAQIDGRVDTADTGMSMMNSGINRLRDLGNTRAAEEVRLRRGRLLLPR